MALANWWRPGVFNPPSVPESSGEVFKSFIQSLPIGIVLVTCEPDIPGSSDAQVVEIHLLELVGSPSGKHLPGSQGDN